MTLEKGPSGSRTVDVLTIERELEELWAKMTEVSPDQEQQAVMRACVLNLVVYTSGEESLGEIGHVMSQVSDEHPGRFIVILLMETTEPPIGAMVTAQCHPAERGRKQICCEQIVIKASREQMGHLPSFVRPLLIPDLPVFLWWREVPDSNHRVFQALVDEADRLIVDSGRLADSEKGLRTLAEFVHEVGNRAALSDLSWGRMRRWRRLVAGYYDSPEYRPHLARIDSVEIECGPGENDQVGTPVEALLTVSWMASRLGWELRGEPERAPDGSFQFQLGTEGRYIAVAVNISQTGPGLQRIRLAASRQPTASFLVSFSGDGSYLKTDVEISGVRRAERVARMHQREEAFLIARELEILGHDRVYEQALGFLGRWLN
ncbi:glucose-6-phosphate dehydrogenase assembly protein OpcA [Acidobacteria bacterium AH-259-D05]|nr:glucose-6-phosphate dehydrogenase assembly protein OpcA [Acidobacteria bacterium AH-259-D05]